MPTLKDALQTFVDDAVLIEDGTDFWTVSNLLDALDARDLGQEVYSCENCIARLDDQGSQISPPMYTICAVGETPYFVKHEQGGYRVLFMLNKEQAHSRFIYGQSLYRNKQSAYRRKSSLNKRWQEERVLGA